jgi:hypothetical protein
MSTFEYILNLNMRAGKSFSDVSEYPMFPDLTKEVFNPSAQIQADWFFRGESVGEAPDVIYEMRKRLESARISKILHLWLSSQAEFFGDSLLTTHPERNITWKQGTISYQADCQSRVLAAAPSSARDLVVLTENGIVSEVHCVLATGSGMNVGLHQTLEVPQDPVCVFSEKRIAVFSRAENKAMLLGEGLLVFSSQVYAETELVACSRDAIFYCPDPYSIVSLTGSEEEMTLCQTLSRILRFSISELFRIVVVSTIDGYLRFFDLRSGKLVRAVFLDAEADLIMITPSWGFVLALSDRDLFVLSVNGVLCKKLEGFGKVGQWWGFRSVKGFDYVVFVNEKRVGVFEAFRPESVSWFLEVKQDVVYIGYDVESGHFLVVTAEGQIEAVPCPPLE